MSYISFTRIERLSSPDAREGPSYADLQALRVDGVGLGGVRPLPLTRVLSFCATQSPMGPPHSESEEIGFDQGLIRPSASSTLTRRPPDRVSDGPVSCRIQGLQTTVPASHIPGLILAGKWYLWN